MSGREIGRVAALFRYPVKSMGVEALETVEVGWAGLAGDRRWAFVRDGMIRSGFPWLTIREHPLMWKYQPRFVEPDKPDTSPTMVRTPSGGDFDVVDPQLAAELGDGVRVIKQDRGVFDAMPLSLITTQTIGGLGEFVGAELDPRRFRPNLLIEALDDAEFPEDTWMGGVLRVGGMRMRIDKRDKRCVVINVDPVTTGRDPAILRAVAQERDARLGVYGTTVQPGRASVGDPVVLES
ncbi:MAG: MOSC N-terminal beta barrel domain-containing protein [Gemmatimonadales bacterium]